MSAGRIGFDARMWDHPGIGRYVRELSKELISQPLSHEFLFLSHGRFAESLTSAAHSSNDSRFSFKNAASPIYSLSEQFELAFRASGLSALHVPHFNIPVLFKGRLIVTIHDLLYFHEPEASRSRWGRPYVSYLLRRIARTAAAIITVSEFTKRDLLEHVPSVRPERVFVTYEGISSVFRKISDENLLAQTRRRFSLEKPFVLYVGSLKAHKNVTRLVEALRRIRQKKGIPHELVLVGRQDPRNEGLKRLISENAFCRYLGELEDSDLARVYNTAELFVLPSLWEGFGLPVLEAMACGVPVISSDRASLPEVAGGAAALFNPESVDALEGLIYNVLSDNGLRQMMLQKGFQNIQRFSWKDTARQTLEIYNKVMSS